MERRLVKEKNYLVDLLDLPEGYFKVRLSACSRGVCLPRLSSGNGITSRALAPAEIVTAPKNSLLVPLALCRSWRAVSSWDS